MSKKNKSEILSRMNIGLFCRDFSGRFTYEAHDFPFKDYDSKKKEIAQAFGLLPFSATINGVDESFQTYIKGLKRIGIEWDNWSGLSVVAKSKRAENLVEEIGSYLEETIKI